MKYWVRVFECYKESCIAQLVFDHPVVPRIGETIWVLQNNHTIPYKIVDVEYSVEFIEFKKDVDNYDYDEDTIMIELLAEPNQTKIKYWGLEDDCRNN